MRRRGLRARTLLAWGVCTAVAAAMLWLAPAASAAEPGDAGPREPVVRQAYVMGTRATLTTLATDRAQGLATLERMLGEIEAVEAELSTWRHDSLLSAINRQPLDVPRPAPRHLCGLLADLAFWAQATGGAFDPAIGSLVAAWGLRVGGRWPSAEEIAQARNSSGLEHLLVEDAPCRVTRRHAVTLDAGAFGKGAAIDRVAEREHAHQTPAWMIDLGGQVAVGSSARRGWPVALAHPEHRDQPALELRLASGSLATSGGSMRDHLVGGRRIGHIIDPRTGQTLSRAESATVWHERALVADILSTALYVMGVEEGLAWAEAHEVAACFLVPDPAASGATARATSAFRTRFLEELS